jgi:DNA-binding NtrC family response regulator
MLTAKTAPLLVLEPVIDLPRILVVDDESLICDLIFELLNGEYGQVVIEKDGLRALERLESEPFDLVLTDLKLGPTDGMMILERALGFHPEVAVILMTGFPTLENAVFALKAGAYDYITKPFTIDSLRAVVRRAVDHIRLQRENVQLREMVNLKRITEALGSTLELNEVLQVVLNSALAEARADFGAVLLDCREQNRIRLAASLGGEEKDPDLEVLSETENLIEYHRRSDPGAHSVAE